MRRAWSAPALAALCALGLGGALGGMGCGREAGSPGTGSVALLVTDASGSEFERIELLVSKVELLGASNIEIFSGRKTVDLLALESFSNPLFVATDVPVGDYQKVRLTLEDITLVRESEDGRRLEELHPPPPGGGLLDLVPRGSFFVVPGSTLVLEIGIDAEKAIQGDALSRADYDVRPVAYVRVVDGEQDLHKPARLHGEIHEFLGPHAFALCSREIRARRSSEPPRSSASCLAVNLFANTRILDRPGEPLALDALEPGDPVTVMGELRLVRNGAALSTIPGETNGELPFALAALDGSNIQLDALTVERGPQDSEPRPAGPDGREALRTGGLADLDPQARRFDLATAAGSECIEVAADALLLLLADDGKVASASEISLDDLVDGQEVEVFGAPSGDCFAAAALLATAGAAGPLPIPPAAEPDLTDSHALPPG
jgi:hypothetical protein